MSKKHALGKGLAALLGDDVVEKSDDIEDGGSTAADTGQRRSDSHILLKLSDIIPNDEQPRKVFDQRTINELAQSIKEKGILQPVIVTKKNGKYMLVIGERRWRASKAAGLDEIPAFIRNYSQADVLEIALIENIQREDLNPIEEAAAYNHLIEKLKLTHDELSRRLGKSRVSITNKMRLMKLPDIVQDDLATGSLSEGHGRAILYLADYPEKMSLLRDRVVTDNLSVRDTETLAKKWEHFDIEDIVSGQNKDKSKAAEKKKAAEIKDMEERLSGFFGTKVFIDDSNNKGKITIEYWSLDDFQRILDKIGMD
jgi:ParB family chromosome partitioning protein